MTEAPERDDEAIAALDQVPPHALFRDFLDPADHARLRDWTIAHQRDFAPSRVAHGVLLPRARNSRTLDHARIGEWRRWFRKQFAGRIEALSAAVGVAPFAVGRTEVQLLAYGDGAYYRLHRDMTARPEGRGVRVLSCVYYFHAEPKRFTGGELRLHPMRGPGECFADITPEQNMLAVFPSWAPHEVLQVHCPSGRFEDSRFAVNCWVHMADPEAGEGSEAQ